MRYRPGLSACAALYLLGSLLCGLDKPALALNAPTLRYQTDLRGDMLVIGNTMGFDCRTGVPNPVVGTVDRNQCFSEKPASVQDTSADVYWRSDDQGQVTATASISRDQTRTAALLQLPQNVTVAYARIYWSSTEREDTTNITSIVLDRPGANGFSRTIVPAPTDFQFVPSAFQATADVTDLVQTAGSGLYRVSSAGGFPKNVLLDQSVDDNYAAWALIVLYRRDGDPVRNVAIYDGLSFISGITPSSLALSGFVVPPQGASDSKMAVIAYEGDVDLTDDALSFNSMPLSSGPMGSETNFFNSSRAQYGQPVSVTGDLPQLSGQPGSMSGLDINIVNITPYLAANKIDASVQMTTGSIGTSDTYYVGVLATSIVSRKPILDSVLSVPSGLNPLPGDTVEYTLTLRNLGDDTASGVIFSTVLPPELVFVPGSLRIISGANSGSKTDAASDDQGEYDAASRTLRVRLGNGANATQGGTLMVGEAPIVVKYLVQIADSANGAIASQATLSGTPAAQPTVVVTSYPSGDGSFPNHATVIVVRPCMSNYDCTVTAPVCDLRANPHQCTATCMADADCQGAPGGQDICSSTDKTCVQCTETQRAACTPDGLGSACLSSGACGCMNNADCGGRTCDTANHTCPKPQADLGIALTSEPDPADIDHPITISVVVSNKGPAVAPSGAQLSLALPTGGMILSVDATQGWRCALSDGTVRCTYFRPIAPGASSPSLRIAIGAAQSGADDPNQSSLMIQASLSANSSIDPNSDDNTITKTIEIGRYQVAGGGLGCSLTAAEHTASLWSAAAVALTVFVSLRRRRRITRASHA